MDQACIDAHYSEIFKGALGVCFALKLWKEYLLLFTYLITLGKDIPFRLLQNLKQTGI